VNLTLAVGSRAGEPIVLDLVILRQPSADGEFLLAVREVTLSAALEEILPGLAGLAATSEAVTLPDVAARALTAITAAVGAEVGLILRWTDRGDRELLATHGLAPEEVDALLRLPYDATMARERLASHGQVLTGDPRTIARRPAWRSLAVSLGIRWVSVVGLSGPPLVSGQVALGWRTGPRHPLSRHTLRQLGIALSAALTNAQLVAELSHRLEVEQRMTRVVRALASLALLPEEAPDLESLARATLEQVLAALDGWGGSYSLVDSSGRLVPVTRVGRQLAHGQDLPELPDETGLMERFRAGAGAVVDDLSLPAGGPSGVAGEPGRWAWVALPITSSDDVVGALVLLVDRPAATLDLEPRVLDAIAHTISLSLASFQLRRRLQTSEENYRALFEQSPEAYLVVDPAGVIQEANAAAGRLFRVPVSDLRHRRLRDLTLASDDERRRWRDRVASAGRATVRALFLRPDDTTFPGSVDLSLVETADGPRYLALIHDRTDEERLQAELVQAQKMEALGQLVSGVAHELNNPLASIVAFSQLIRSDPRLPEELREDAALLVQEADRTRRIVENLLDFARQRPPRREPTDLATLIRRALDLQAYSLDERWIRTVVDVPPDLPPAAVDPQQILQVLLNLTLNAIQAIRSTGRTGELRVEARRQGGRLIVRVVDDGPGVAPENRDRLFVPFFTTKEPGEGTGLGLSVSFGIVAAHGGRLWYEPRPDGPGAVFVLELPVAQRDTTATSPPPRTPRVRVAGPPLRILVLDDEPSIRAFLERVLRGHGFEPILVADGPSAVRWAVESPPDLLLLDQRMAGMTGIDVFEAIVAQRPHLARRFVFMSGDVLNPELRAFATRTGVPLLAKPFEVDQLLAAIAEVLDASAAGEREPS
jgi:PAS domain S-box-containing protein